MHRAGRKEFHLSPIFLTMANIDLYTPLCMCLSQAAEAPDAEVGQSEA